MRERPILFSAPMVRALLDGTKTQTRRVVKPQPAAETFQVTPYHHPDNQPRFYAWKEGFGGAEMHPGWEPIRCPYGQPGDRLRVKEAAWMWCERRPNGKTPTGRNKWFYAPMRGAPVLYAADHPTRPVTSVASPDTGNVWGWRLKIGRFLPAWASRITLEVTGARVERLRGISESDARAEGARECDPVSGREVLLAGPSQRGSFVLHYRDIWEQINGPGSWDVNPWVWVVEFKVVKP